MRNVVKKILTVIGVTIGGFVMYVMTPIMCMILIFILLSAVACGVTAIMEWDKYGVKLTLQGYDDAVYYSDGEFGDITKYGEYYFNEKSIKKFEKIEDYSKVTESNIEYVRSYFTNFEDWLKWTDFENKYTFDKNTQIDVGDYYYIYNEYEDKPYDNYDVYYVDMDNNTVYFAHSNI